MYKDLAHVKCNMHFLVVFYGNAARLTAGVRSGRAHGRGRQRRRRFVPHRAVRGTEPADVFGGLALHPRGVWLARWRVSAGWTSRLLALRRLGRAFGGPGERVARGSG